MKFTAVTFAAFAPSVTLALVGNQWTFPKSPNGGLKDITFPINMANVSHVSGYYFAQQFKFENVENVGYTGIQPRHDFKGKSRVHAAFSSFQKGTTSSDPNCHQGADGGQGVSCAVDIDGNYDHTYNLVVENTSGTTWSGTLVDRVTGQKTHIGSWTLPSGAGGIKSRQLGFVEYYPWNSVPSHNCSDLPKTQASFYNPSTNTPGAGAGDIGKPYEYGDCQGKVNFSETELTTPSGWKVDVGF